MYHLVHYYTGHTNPLGSFTTLEEAKAEFDYTLANWGEVTPDDQWLEVWYDCEDDMSECQDCICYHEFTDPETWED